MLIVFVIFGAGKLPKVMGDLGKGVKNLRDGLKGEEEKKPTKTKQSKKKPRKVTAKK